MPSMTTKRLGDLEAERTNFLLYERRIIDERDEILTNVTIHLDQLDAEIVRLGGTARDRGGGRASSRPSSRPPSGVSDEDGIASSSATVEGFSSTTMNDGRSAISSSGLAVRHGMTISATSSRGFERRSGHIEERLSSCDRAPPSSSSSEDPNEEGAHLRPFVNGAASPSMVGERCDALSAVDASKGRATTEKRKHGRKRKRQSVVARDDDGTTLGEPWTCECGHEMAAGRARCGKCRRWKGGKRLVRWSVKPRDPTATIAGGVVASPPPSSSSSLSGRRGRNDERGEEGADVLPIRAIDAYRNACSDSNATVTMAAGDSFGRDLAIHAVLERMVLAVAHISDPVRAKKKATVGSRTSNNGQVAVASMKGDTPGTNKTGEIVTSQKRKRGRPKKETNGTDPEQIIRRSVSNSGEDSDNNGPEDQRKRGRPRKSPAANKDAREGAKQHQADGISSSAARATLQHHPSRDAEETKSAASDGTLSPSTVNISTGGDL